MTIEMRTSEIAGYRLTYRLEEIPLRRGVSYAIAVRIDTDNGTEDAAVHDVSRNRAEAKALFHVIVKGLVTPCTLADVLEDLL